MSSCHADLEHGMMKSNIIHTGFYLKDGQRILATAGRTTLPLKAVAAIAKKTKRAEVEEIDTITYI
ncbi:hypothetical protein NECAME_03245 [Necator americanus]|uniref:Uncharacterized protein n=1 Tax=Necator americanus TaxID=51031 RepID=W2T536_NECAM|nr:hypothetical protein NECAME_03245 [Necator americanus]ETN77145.1 hypothetical protein NECAME_03245 [Necator americanus]